MKNFSYRTTVKGLQEDAISLDFSYSVEIAKEMDWEDEVQIDYDSEEDTLTGVIVEGNLSFGHIFDPTSFEHDPDFVTELSKLK